LVNTLSILSPYGAEEKQALLEARDLRARAEALVALAEMELASRDDGSGTSIQ
jgi:Lon protease-like protein